MDILYILGSGSKWSNNELRYSLRSLEKFGKNVGRVFVCGERPDFINDNVFFRAAPDCKHRKHKNILYKVMTAMWDLDMPEHFLISSDDHFYLKEVDFDNYPIYYKNRELPSKVSIQHRKEYFFSLVQTRKLLEKYDLPIYQTNPHCNTHWDIRIYNENKSLFDESLELEYGGEMNCIMGNLMIAEGATPVQYSDLKLKDFRNLNEAKERMAGRECFSIHDNAIRNGIDTILSEMFPDKSRWEK